MPPLYVSCDPTVSGFVAFIQLVAVLPLRGLPQAEIEDVEQLVYEAHLVFDMRLTGEAMSSADHPHHLEPLHRSGGRLHCLKASRGANDSLKCAVVRFNEVVQILARAMLGIA